jgi:ribosomal protein L40E
MSKESSTDAETPGENEQYCRECGAIVLKKAEICPECGVKQQQGATARNPGAQSPAGGGGQPAATQNTPQGSAQSYGLVFSIIDSWKYQKAIRHLLNAVLAFSTVGTYLVVLLIEGLIHYRNLNNGDSEPYDESKQKVWTTFTDVQ